MDVPPAVAAEQYRREAWEDLERARHFKHLMTIGQWQNNPRLLELFVKRARLSMRQYQYCRQMAEIEDRLQKRYINYGHSPNGLFIATLRA